MSAFKNDGSIPYASRVVTINSVAYIAENISVKRPAVIIERRNELNEPSGWVGIADFITGTATLQMASTSTAQPPAGQTFSTTFDATIGAETFVITEIDKSESQGDAKKFEVTF